MVTSIAVGTMAVALAAGIQDPGFRSEPVRIAFTDAGGAPQTSPVFSVSGMRPGMQPQRGVLTLRNVAEAAETFTVTAQVHANGSRSLDRVLMVRVIDRASGATIYRGSLSGLRFQGPILRAGLSASYVVEVRWPETSAENAYQGASLSFEFTAVAAAA